MTVKAKVDFINAVANGSKIPCPECESENKPEARFCTICGTALVKPEVKGNKPDSTTVAKEAPQSVAAKSVQPLIMPKKNSETPIIPKPKAEPREVIPSDFEEQSAFANGLPPWTLEPPQILVKRRNLK